MTTEPEILYVTLRDAIDENDVEMIHVECRFKDGQKFAAVQVAGGFDNLAARIAKFLNEEKADADYRYALSCCGEHYAEMAGDLEVATFIQEFRDGVPTLPLCKLNRWLGYIQGTLIAAGLTTVETERDLTRPFFRPLDF